MARDGCFDQLDVAFSRHPNDCNMMPPGPVLANDSIRYSFTGKASHAAAPEAGRSALDALELMNIGVQFLREHIPSSARIIMPLRIREGFRPISFSLMRPHCQIRAPFAPELSGGRMSVSTI